MDPQKQNAQPNVNFNKGKGNDNHVIVNYMPVQNTPQPRKSLFKRLNSFTDQPASKNCLRTKDVEAEELLKAVSENDVKLCENLLASVDLSKKNCYFFHPLLLAAQKGYCEIIKLLIQNGVDINVKDSKNSSALHFAIKQLHSKSALLLLEEGINFRDLRDCHGNYAIHLAALEGKKVVEVVQWLLNNGQIPNVINKKGQTPLHLAATKGHDGIIELLLENERIPAKWDAKDSQCRYPIHYAALNGHSSCCRLLLNKNTIQAAAVDKEGNTPLILVATKGHARCCAALLPVIDKIGLELKDSKGNTALHHAASNGFIKTIQILLEANASCSIPNNNGNTPIHMAALQKNMECLKILTEKYEGCPGTNNLQQGLLHIAAIHSCEQSLSYLLNLNSCISTINDQDSTGRTPLHHASLSSNLENVRILLERGANCKAMDKDDNSSLHLAASKGLTDICKQLLQEKGIEMINVKNKEGNTPLHLASRNGSLYCCKYLMIKGAFITIKNCDGFSPYHVAAAKGNLEILKFFTKKKGSLLLEVVEGTCDFPLHLVAKNGHFECCQYILNHLKKNSILNTNESDYCALDEAFLGKHDEIFAIILSNCPLPKHNCNNYEFEATLHSYMHEALISKRETVQSAIIESDWWFSGFSSSFCKDGYCNNLLHLIKSNVEFARRLFAKCIEEIDGEVIYDFRIFEQEFYISPESKDDSFLIVESPFDLETGKLQDGCNTFQTENQESNSPLQGCIENDCRELIQHPLITEYWKYKWSTYLRHILYVMLSMEIFIVLILTLYMSHVWNWDQVNATLSTRNESLSNFTCREDLVTKFEPSWILLITLRAIMALIVLIMCLSEIHMIKKFNFKSYLTVGVGTRVCRIIGIFILILPLTLCSCEVWITTSWQWLFGITALLASWFNMIHTLNLVPQFSVFMPITKKFLASFFLVLGYILLILLIFSFIFYLIFNEHPAFANLGVAFIKSIVWILGDLAYDDMFISETKPLLYPIFSNIIFVMYVTSIGGFIVNLIITQPADHFESFRSDAAWYKASSRIQLLLKFDKILFKLRRNFTVGFWVKNSKADIKTLIRYKLYGHHDGKVTPKKIKTLPFMNNQLQDDLTLSNKQVEILLAKIEELKNYMSEQK